MSIVERKYSAFAGGEAKVALDALLSSTHSPSAYSAAMQELGKILGSVVEELISPTERCLLASTAEDADHLSKGIYDRLIVRHATKAAVFWNNHYRIPGGSSVSPVVHRFLQPGFEDANVLVIAKSIISGSCVVRTNILELVELLSLEKIYIVAPIMHVNSESALRKEFPDNIAEKFEFVYLALDSKKTSEGEIVPGIGGEVYPLLGLIDQPVRATYMPNLVRELAFL